MTIEQEKSGRLLASELNTRASKISSLVRLYEAAAGIVAAGFGAKTKEEKMRAEFAQKHLEMVTEHIENLLAS